VERLILDTSVWIAIERGKLDLDEAVGRKKLILPAIVAGELKQALYTSSRTEAKMQKSLDFFAMVESLTEFAPIDQRVADRYAEIKHFSMASGKPRGTADLLLAATAIEYKASSTQWTKRQTLAHCQTSCFTPSTLGLSG
jgi:predicted nucleic acid-binding protein